MPLMDLLVGILLLLGCHIKLQILEFVIFLEIEHIFSSLANHNLSSDFIGISSGNLFLSIGILFWEENIIFVFKLEEAISIELAYLMLDSINARKFHVLTTYV